MSLECISVENAGRVAAEEKETYCPFFERGHEGRQRRPTIHEIKALIRPAAKNIPVTKNQDSSLKANWVLRTVVKCVLTCKGEGKETIRKVTQGRRRVPDMVRRGRGRGGTPYYKRKIPQECAKGFSSKGNTNEWASERKREGLLFSQNG